MNLSTSVTFGPGALESIRLNYRTRMHATIPRQSYVQVRAQGTFRVYCGEGWEHQVPIRGAWTPLADYGQHQDDPSWVAHDQVEAALSDWVDPCQAND